MRGYSRATLRMRGMSASVRKDPMHTTNTIAVRTYRPKWLTCDRCGHVWKSRANIGPPRCSRCEQSAKRAAVDASRLVTDS